MTRKRYKDISFLISLYGSNVKLFLKFLITDIVNEPITKHRDNQNSIIKIKYTSLDSQLKWL